MKYKFTERTKEYQNITLHEIEASGTLVTLRRELLEDGLRSRVIFLMKESVG